jgi:hypothetical protein
MWIRVTSPCLTYQRCRGGFSALHLRPELCPRVRGGVRLRFAEPAIGRCQIIDFADMGSIFVAPRRARRCARTDARGAVGRLALDAGTVARNLLPQPPVDVIDSRPQGEAAPVGQVVSASLWSRRRKSTAAGSPLVQQPSARTEVESRWFRCCDLREPLRCIRSNALR